MANPIAAFSVGVERSKFCMLMGKTGDLNVQQRPEAAAIWRVHIMVLVH
jgi:hypothetical protein